MRTKPIGSRCKLYYDTNNDVKTGDYVVSSGGSGYLVQDARHSKTKPQRFNLTCLRCDPVDIPDGSFIHPLHWHKRSRKETNQQNV
ncbi:MAG TPA: hypothetical protein VGB77_06555 [Abditibacteriaceae bacterium]|jgi:hypothetical protein